MKLFIVYTKDITTQKDFDIMDKSMREQLPIGYSVIVIPSEIVEKIELYDNNVTTTVKVITVDGVDEKPCNAQCAKK